MGLLLQKFYQHCSLLPLGVGIAGGAMASRQYQWASGNELLQQINALSSYTHQPAPPSLQAHGFQTIICIPLQKNAGVLEIGTTELVPESTGVLSQVLKFINTFSIQLGRRGLTTSLPLNIGGQYLGKTEEHMTPGSASNAMQMYESRATRQPSLSSSYHSSSSANSSSPSLEQTPHVTTTMLSLSPAHNSFNRNEEMTLISPVSSRQAAPMSMVRSSFDQLDILNEMGHIDTLYSRSSHVSMPSLSLEIDNAQHDRGSCHFDQDHRQISDSPTFSYRNVGALSLMPSFLTEYMPEQPMSDHHTSADQLVFESAVIQPLQGADHNAGNIIDLVKDASAGELLTNPIHEKFALPGVISSDHHSRIRAKGKHNIWVDEAEKIRSKCTTQMQGSISTVNSLSAARSLYDQDVSLYETARCGDGIKDQPKSGFIIMRAFRPWTSRMKKPKSTTNRYNVKMIMRIHLPRIGDMMNAEAARAARYVFQRRRTLTAPKMQQPLGAAEAHADYATALADSSNMNIKVNAAQQNDIINEAPSAKQHMFAERNRRRKQGDCLGVLRTLVPNISKRDKVTTLERTIEYLKEMQSLVHDLQQQRNSFQNYNAKDVQNINQSADHLQNIDATLKGLANFNSNSNSNSPASLLRNATCVFHHSARDKHVLPHFELDLNIKLRDTEANASLITIITGLQQRKLQCIDLKMEFHQSSSNLSAKILAQYKDEQNSIPTLAKIKDIKQWWTNHIDKFSK